MNKYILHILSILTRKEKNKFFLQIAYDLIISLLDILFLTALIIFIQLFTQKGYEKNVPEWYNYISNHLLFSLITFCILFCIKNVTGYYISAQQHNLLYKIASRISKRRMDSYLEANFNVYTETNSASHIYQISQLPIEFCHYVLRGFQVITGQCILILFSIIAILIYKPNLFILLSCVLLPSVLIISFLMKRRITFLRSQTKAASARSLQFLNEALNGFIESKIYGKKDFFTRRYSNAQEKVNNYLGNLQAIQNMPSRLMETFAVTGFLLLILISADHATIKVSFAILGAFMAAAYKIIPALVKIINASGQIKAYHFTVNELLQNHFTPSEVNTPVESDTIKSVEFNNVSFGYGEHALLKDFNLKIKKGEFVGISGLSGKGKTTIINLLLGFLDPDNGIILFNNKNTTNLSRLHHQEKISYVKQTPFLINDSLLANISLSDASNHNEKIERITQQTGVDQLINGYGSLSNKMIFESGKNISGGQRQRIALSRALYKDFDLIILDEPFSELDNKSEWKLVTHLKQIAEEGKMVILISHRKESLSLCNQIISIDGH